MKGKSLKRTGSVIDSFITPFMRFLPTWLIVKITRLTNEKLHLIAIRFKGAGASFFYEEQMEELMQIPKEPILLEKNILENELDTYFKNRLRPSKLPFNIMKIIDLLDEQGSEYSIDEVLAIANVPRKILDKMFSLRTGLTFKTYATLTEFGN